jgi:hypothetical protein
MRQKSKVGSEIGRSLAREQGKGEAAGSKLDEMAAEETADLT